VRFKGSISGVEHTLVDVAIAAVKPGCACGARRRSRKQGPLKRVQIYKVMRRYWILAGDKTHPHALKYSCVTHLSKLLIGNLIEVQDHVGHADPRSTCAICGLLRGTRAELLADWGKRALPPCPPVVAGEQH
jgi:hypothetical protein